MSQAEATAGMATSPVLQQSPGPVPGLEAQTLSRAGPPRGREDA